MWDLAFGSTTQGASVITAVARTEDIVDVERGLCFIITPQLVEGHSSVVADAGFWLNELIEGAVVLELGIVELLVNQTMPVGHLESGRGAIILPVGDTIADHHTLQVWQESVWVVQVSLDVVVHQPKKVGNVNASVRLSRDIKIVALELRELLEPSKDCLEVVLCRIVVREFEAHLRRVCKVRIANTSWLLDVQHVSFSVPAVGIRSLVPGCISILPLEGSVFLHETKH